MRMIDPGPGELLDRTTILNLKIAAGHVAGKPTGHFESELEKIELLLDKFKSGNDSWTSWIEALSQVNRRVWVAIDRLREAALGDTPGAAFWGLEAMYGNDERMLLIQEINRACGQPAAEEKIR